MANQAQVRAIYTLLGKLGLRDEKESIVSGFTGGRTRSVRAMGFEEAKALVAHLKNMDPENGRAEKMRNKILSMAHEMNWTINGRVDMVHVNNWCITYGHAHKALDDCNYSELPALVTQFEQVYKSHIKSV